MVQAGLVLEGGGMKGISQPAYWISLWKRIYTFRMFMVSQREPAICAAIYPGSLSVLIMYHWITSEIRITAACAVC